MDLVELLLMVIIVSHWLLRRSQRARPKPLSCLTRYGELMDNTRAAELTLWLRAKTGNPVEPSRINPWAGILLPPTESEPARPARPAVSPSAQLPAMNPLVKLRDVLPKLAGKTIERTMLVIHADGGFQVWLFFTDGTSYEFYGRNDISGARTPDGTTVEQAYRSVRSAGVEVLLAPDRRKVSRGS